MQNRGSGYGKVGSRYQPYGRTTQQRGGAFINEGNPSIRNMPFGHGTSVAREYKSSSRASTALLDSPEWGSRSLDRGFQKRESRQHDVAAFVPKKEFVDSYERTQDRLGEGDFDRGGDIRFDSYQTSSQGFENRDSDRNRSYGRKDQSRSYDDLDSYRTSENRSHKNWLDEEPYESLLSRTKVDIDSYRTTTGGTSSSFTSFGKTERYQTSDSHRLMSKPILSQSTYSRPALNTQTYDSPRYSGTQDSRSDYYNKGTNRNYDKPLDKYNFQGGTGSTFDNRSTFGSNSSKMLNFQNIDSYSTSNKPTDFKSVLERRSRRVDSYNRGGDRMNEDDNVWRSNLTSRLDYVIRRNTDEDFTDDDSKVVASRGQIRNMDFVGNVSAFNQNQNASQMRSRSQGRQEGLFAKSPSRQDMQLESYFTQKSNRPEMFVQEDSLPRKQMGFDTRRQDVRSMVKEGSMFKRQIVRQQEREGNKQFFFKKRQEMRGMGRPLLRDIEMISEEDDRGRHGFKETRKDFRPLRSTRSLEMLRSNRRMMPEQNIDQGHLSALSSQQRMMEDRKKQEELRQIGKLKMEQEVARKQLIEKEARAMALKNQVTIAKQQAQEKTILMQATLMKRQRQIAELMRKRQMLSQNLRTRAQTRLHSSSLVRTMSQRLKDRARLLETQRRSLEIRSRLLRNRNVARGVRSDRGLPRKRRASVEKRDRKRNVSAESPGKVPVHCDVCSTDISVPFKQHILSISHKNKVKQQESLHAKNAEMFYCEACNFKVKGPLEYHNALKQHENRVNAIKKGCELCIVSSFADGKELDKHQASLQHQKLLNVLKKPKTPEVQKHSPSLCDICNVRTDSSLEVHHQLASHKAREKAVKQGCAACKISSFTSGKELDKHRASLQHSKCVNDKKEALIKKTIDDHLMQFKSETEIPAFVSGKAFGVEFVIPSQGYACQLCQKNRKFYLSEQSARVDHCKSEQHYDHWKENELKLIKESESEENLRKTPSTNTKELAVEVKTAKKVISTDDALEAKQQADHSTPNKPPQEKLSVEVDKTKPKMEIEQEISKTENKKESETLTSGEEQDMENYKIVDSVESDAEEESASSTGVEAKEDDVKSDESKSTTEEIMKTQVSPRGRGRGRVQKARRGRKLTKT
ncbi:uncharacterized protein LOC121384462 [Gigantopelta aegis]|uniref:uncharacterized protein LOC121384462 n=1 Tax=Gigantopelta aegis TaxID=1735272 RepID=UPI001B88D03D|nr:uncharacterized protein LOC121384462 [Gigantopelta aegis]